MLSFKKFICENEYIRASDGTFHHHFNIGKHKIHVYYTKRTGHKKYNVDFTERPEYYASSKCNNSEYYEYLANSVSTEYIMILQPTAPLLNDSTLINCYNEFSKNLDKYDSLVTVQYAKKHAWYNNKPINYDLKNTPNSQDLNPIVFPTFNVMICKVSSLLKTKNAITEKCLFYQVEDNEAIEIDDQLEFDVAEFLYNKFKNENK